MTVYACRCSLVTTWPKPFSGVTVTFASWPEVSVVGEAVTTKCVVLDVTVNNSYPTSVPSLAVMVCAPTPSNVAVKVPVVPPFKLSVWPDSGRPGAVPSELVSVIVPEKLLVGLLPASSAITVTVNGTPADSVDELDVTTKCVAAAPLDEVA